MKRRKEFEKHLKNQNRIKRIANYQQYKIKIVTVTFLNNDASYFKLLRKKKAAPKDKNVHLQ